MLRSVATLRPLSVRKNIAIANKKFSNWPNRFQTGETLPVRRQIDLGKLPKSHSAFA